MNSAMCRTDLACESLPPHGKAAVPVHSRIIHGISAEEMHIRPGADEESSGRSPGRYATLHCGKIWLFDRKESLQAQKAVAELLRQFLADALGRAPGKETGILVAGLGNRFITPDSIGPRTADLVTVTNHAREEEHLLSLLDCVRVSAFSPGVLGQTGFEAAALIAEASKAAEADAIVAVDALAARSTSRLGTTVQISDTGIRPGSGLGSCRTPITREEMGIPVIAVGVPTVVDSATLVWDALEQAGIDHPSEALRQVLHNGRSFIVSPKESDVIADSVAELLSGAINRALTPLLL